MQSAETLIRRRILWRLILGLHLLLMIFQVCARHKKDWPVLRNNNLTRFVLYVILNFVLHVDPKKIRVWPRGYKKIFMLNSAEHEL